MCIRDRAELVYSGNSDRYWSVQTLIDTGDVDKLPNLFLYMAVTAVYLVLLGPGLYLFLKNWDLQIYYRRGVLVLSLVGPISNGICFTLSRNPSL